MKDFKVTREQALKIQAWKQAVIRLTFITVMGRTHKTPAYDGVAIWYAVDKVRALENELFPGMDSLLYPGEKASVEKLEEGKAAVK